jgi:uncharacterized protein
MAIEILETLIIFTRYPTVGRVKMSLIPHLGAAGAAQLHRQMAELTIDRARKLRQQRSIGISIYYEGSDFKSMCEWLGADLDYYPQSGSDLGANMVGAIDTTFRAEIDRAIAIGTDCPQLSVDILAAGFDLLSDRDLVLGPTTGGSYYLVGMNYLYPTLFVGIDWGTSIAYGQTLSIAQRMNLTIGDLPDLTAIDRPEDLELWERYKIDC